MPKQLKNRTVEPDGEAIQRLRIEKGWRVEDLAEKARCSLKTVENVERGANVYLYTLRKFAQALGVEVSTLMTGAAPPPLPKERSWTITIRITTPDDEAFDESTDLPRFMAKLIERLGGDDMEPRGIRRGSVNIDVEITAEQIMLLIDAYQSGRLDDLGIERISAPFSFVDRSRGHQRFGNKEMWVRQFPELVKEFRRLPKKRQKKPHE